VDILSQKNFYFEDRFRQNIVGSFSFICLCPLFVFYLAKWFWDVPNSSNLHTGSNEWPFHLFLSIFQFWEYKYLNLPTTSCFTFQSDFEKKLHQILWFFVEEPINNPSFRSLNIFGFWDKNFQNPMLLRRPKLDDQISWIATHRKIST